MDGQCSCLSEHRTVLKKNAKLEAFACEICIKEHEQFMLLSHDCEGWFVVKETYSTVEDIGSRVYILWLIFCVVSSRQMWNLAFISLVIDPFALSSVTNTPLTVIMALTVPHKQCEEVWKQSLHPSCLHCRHEKCCLIFVARFLTICAVQNSGLWNLF